MLSEVFRHAFKDLPFPLITSIFPQLAGMAEKKRHTTELKRMFEEIVDQKIKDYDADNKPSDFIEVSR